MKRRTKKLLDRMGRHKVAPKDHMTATQVMMHIDDNFSTVGFCSECGSYRALSSCGRFCRSCSPLEHDEKFAVIDQVDKINADNLPDPFCSPKESRIKKFLREEYIPFAIVVSWIIGMVVLCLTK